MLFNSLEFLIFFPSVVILYFLMAHRYRWVLLLVASYYFYMAWKPEYILLIVVSTIIDYWCSGQMGKFTGKRERKPYLYLSLLSNLGILFTFKYFNFFNHAAADIASWLGGSVSPLSFELLLPMGISFYTFQTMSYSIDVYHGRLKPEKHFGKFALFVTFFPQLVAGPIERATHLLPQFHRKFSFDYDRVSSGLKQMAWGLFKKVVIADRVAVLVNAVYGQPEAFEGFSLILATVFFAFQIYCDFSGYSDIAIGAARVLGFDLMKNFETPYFSRTISEFWKRWHISLSTWFRDYLYIPLGGNRVVKWRWYYNLFITFLVSGFWHGANWTFLIWGGLHGLYLILAIVLKPIRTSVNSLLHLHERPSLMRAIDVVIVFVLVNIGWIFFRAESVESAFYILTHLIDFQTGDVQAILNTILGLLDGSFQLGTEIVSASGVSYGLTVWGFILAIGFLSFLIAADWLQQHINVAQKISQSPTFIRWTVYYLVLYSIIMFRHVGSGEFIYFQF